ncbi:MAG: hypothetical protein NTW49_00630 [Bacteroidia bacterium]|nr:hypothetical protein [Bacteroidia bacterium]
MKTKRYNILIVFYAILFNSCGTYMRSTTLDPITNYFPADRNETATVITNIPVNADTLKNLLVVSKEYFWLEMGKNMNFFKEVITLSELENQIIKNNLQDKVITISDKLGLKRAYEYYKPFVYLTFTNLERRDGFFAGIILYNPNKAEIIFKNEILINKNSNTWSDQSTLYPLFNSLLDYLREQK